MTVRFAFFGSFALSLFEQSLLFRSRDLIVVVYSESYGAPQFLALPLALAVQWYRVFLEPLAPNIRRRIKEYGFLLKFPKERSLLGGLRGQLRNLTRARATYSGSFVRNHDFSVPMPRYIRKRFFSQSYPSDDLIHLFRATQERLQQYQEKKRVENSLTLVPRKIGCIFTLSLNSNSV